MGKYSASPTDAVMPFGQRELVLGRLVQRRSALLPPSHQAAPAELRAGAVHADTRLPGRHCVWSNLRVESIEDVSVIYTASKPRGTDTSQRDRKRCAWLLSVVWPLMPFVGLGAHRVTGNGIVSAIPWLVSYGLMPLMDAVLGTDPTTRPKP